MKNKIFRVIVLIIISSLTVYGNRDVATKDTVLVYRNATNKVLELVFYVSNDRNVYCFSLLKVDQNITQGDEPRISYRDFLNKLDEEGKLKTVLKSNYFVYKEDQLYAMEPLPVTDYIKHTIEDDDVIEINSYRFTPRKKILIRDQIYSRE